MEAPDASQPLPEPRAGPFAALEHRDFRLYWGGQMVSTAGTEMQRAAVAWQIYLLTHSALALGLIGLVRVGPIVGFSLWGGVVADALDRRRLLLLTQTLLLLVSAGLAAVTLAGAGAAWAIYLLTALAAGVNAFDNPARQSLVPALVPAPRLANAFSLSSTAYEVAAIGGPSLAGIIIAARGVAGVYVLDVISFLAVLVALTIIRPRATEGEVPRISVKAALEGLRFVRRTPIILSTMLLDLAATFFGSATALLPIFARDILHVGSQGYGVLYAAPSAGAVLAGAVMSWYVARLRKKGGVIILAVAAYGLATALFGLSRSFPLSVLALAGVGAADTVSTILRQTVRQTVTPDFLRGRMTSVNMVFFMGGPQLGEFEAGAVARAFGAPLAVISGGLAAVVATALIARFASGLRRYSG